MMVRGSMVLALVLAGSPGCGSEPLEPAVLGELCGIEGPFRLAALTPDQGVLGNARQIAGRFIYSIRPAIEDPDVYLPPITWSVGMCGEDRRRLADDIMYIRTDARWPDVALGCREDAREIVTLDPAGIEPPHLVYSGVDCSSGGNSWAFVTLVGEDEDDPASPATLTIVPHVDDPRTDTAEPIVLLAPDTHPEVAISADSQMYVTEDSVYILTVDARLLRVALPDGEVTVEQTGVFQFEFSNEDRYLLYQDLASTSDDPQRREGLVFLRDRTTGEGQLLARTNLNYFTGWQFTNPEGLIVLMLPTGRARVYFVPTLEFVDLPKDYYLLEPLPDGRWLIQAWTGPIYMVDLHDLAAPTKLFGGGDVVRIEPDGATIIDAPICCGDEDSEFAEGSLWFVPFDGSTPRRLAERASQGLRHLDERRIVTGMNIEVLDEGQGRADLVLLDRETGEERLIDRDVRVWMWGLSVGIQDDIVSYSVLDGERSGIWIARLPP